VDNQEILDELLKKFFNIVDKYNLIDSELKDFGVPAKIHHKEVHMVAHVGDNPNANMTMMASHLGVTKGAVSQVISKLEEKGIVRRYKQPGNSKEVLVELTDDGKIVYKTHKEIHSEMNCEILTQLDSFSSEQKDFLLFVFDWLDKYMDKKINMFCDPEK
jgi:DNA-binding MarR family transcriptional regulator